MIFPCDGLCSWLLSPSFYLVCVETKMGPFSLELFHCSEAIRRNSMDGMHNSILDFLVCLPMYSIVPHVSHPKLLSIAKDGITFLQRQRVKQMSLRNMGRG